MKLASFILAAASAALAPATASAGAKGPPVATGDLAIDLASSPSSTDPHFHNLGPNNMLAAHIYDALTNLNRNFAVQPALAESYRNIDPQTWEFTLRKNVKFHDGSAFDANDVVFSLCRIPKVANSPGPYTVFTKSVQEVRVVDPFTVVIRTRQPNPILDRELANVRIVSDGAVRGETVAFDPAGCKLAADWPAAEDFNNGKLAVGTGPFKLVEFARNDHILLKRNDAYWGEQPAWKTVSMRPNPNPAERMAALLSGKADFIESPPTQDIPRIRTDRNYKISKGLSARAIYLVMEQGMDTPPPGITGTGGRNPFKDLRVRQAVSLALDRDAIAGDVMGGFAKPAEQLLDSSFFGANLILPALAHDPDKARKLLAEAGYPDGFGVTLTAPNDRYMNDAQAAQAIAQMLNRVGLKTTVHTMTQGTFFAKAAKKEFGLMLMGWVPSTGEMSNTLRALVATPDRDKGWGTANQGSHSDPSLDALLQEASTTMNGTKRHLLLGEVSKRAVDRLAVVPVHFEVTPWAMRADLEFKGRPDQHTRAQDIRPWAVDKAAARR